MRTVHLIMNTKGGIGKTSIMSMLAQHLGQGVGKVRCLDIDPDNDTLTAFTGLDTDKIIGIKDGIVDGDAIDQMVLGWMGKGKHSDIVVDTGGGMYGVLTKYLEDDGVPRLLEEHGVKLQVHTILCGGSAMTASAQGMQEQLAIAKSQNRKIYIWLNGYFGLIDVSGKTFEQSPFYEMHIDQIAGLINLEPPRDQLVRDVIDAVHSKGMTYRAAINDDKTFHILQRQRIKMAWDQISGAIQMAGIVPSAESPANSDDIPQNSQKGQKGAA